MSIALHAERGTVTIPAATVAAPIKTAAEAVAGARIRHRRHVEVQADETRVHVSIELAARFGTTLPGLARGVQERVRDALETMCGVTVDAVDVAIEEVG